MPPKPAKLCGIERSVITTFEGMLSKEVYSAWLKIKEALFVYEELHSNCVPKEEVRDRFKLRQKLAQIERQGLSDEDKQKAIGKAIVDSIAPESVVAGIEASMAKGDASTLRMMAGIFGIGTGKENDDDDKAPAAVVNIGFSMVQQPQQAIPVKLEAIRGSAPEL